MADTDELRISDEAVEAAARALYLTGPALTNPPQPFTQGWAAPMARAALAAALPLIESELRERTRDVSGPTIQQWLLTERDATHARLLAAEAALATERAEVEKLRAERWLPEDRELCRQYQRRLHARLDELRDLCLPSHERVQTGTIDDEYERGRAHAEDDVYRVLDSPLPAALAAGSSVEPPKPADRRCDLVRFYFDDADPVAECGCGWRAVGGSATDAFRAWWKHSVDARDVIGPSAASTPESPVESPTPKDAAADIPEGCICTDYCTEDESNPCPHCRAMDVYDPCPVIGFGCGMGATEANGKCDCCTPEQWSAAMGDVWTEGDDAATGEQP